MLEEFLTPEMKAARETVHQALSSEAISPGPEWHQAFCGCNGPDCEELPPEGPWLLGDWIAILAFTNAETGKTWYTRLPSQNLAEHARTGLLHMGLEEFDD